ncbi:Uncharacterized protein FWK35_00000157 [Aphis craccivora]|uniref:Uncharacterized protein n=1 Tax=Aphis craccivora TaxID=307492 RepID=A0A6G0ZRN9_APHCR|nr:Uncharacterized protein FWK35_00000157 [Aphis craccivora]
MLNLNNNNLSFIEKGSQTNDVAMNLTETHDDDYLQECNTSKVFFNFKEKHNRNNLIKNNDENDSLRPLYLLNQQNQQTSYPIEEDRKSYVTDTNNLKHFNMYPTCTLNTYNKNHFNSLTKNLNPNDDVSNGVTRNASIITEPIIQSGQSTRRKNICVTESWREINHVDKIKLTTLLFKVKSLNSEIMPFVNLHALANPFLQIPIQVCRIANSINLIMAEVLCRKRTEVAIISWMMTTQN